MKANQEQKLSISRFTMQEHREALAGMAVWAALNSTDEEFWDIAMPTIVDLMDRLPSARESGAWHDAPMFVSG